MKQIVVTKRKIIIGAAVLLAVAITGVGLYAGSRYLGILQQESEAAEVLPVDEVRAAALGYENENNIDKGLDLYDEQIRVRTDDEQKRELLLNKSNYALNGDRHDIALEAAKEAERIDSNTTTDRALARTYEAMGDKERALVYYKKVLEAIPVESDGLAERYRPVIEAKITELEG